MSIDTRLREEISLCTVAGDAARLEVELAIYLVRAGNFDEARNIYEKHHQSVDFGRNTELSLGLMMLDGLSRYYRDRLFDAAIDRLNRALQLSLAAGIKDFSSRVSAWIGHIFFNSCRYEEMADSLARSISLASEKDVDTLIRVSLTIGDALALCGDFSAAVEWYRYAREKANVIGDRLSVAALMHNRATMALAHCRFSHTCSQPPSPLASAYLSEVESAANFETYIGMNCVLYPYEIWTGRLRMLEGRYLEAVPLLDSYIKHDPDSEKSKVLPAVLCDLAYCNLMVRRGENALELMNRALRLDLSELYKDDLAVLYTYCVEIAKCSGEASKRHDLSTLAERSKIEFINETLALKSQIDRVTVCRPSFEDWPGLNA